MRQGNFDPFLFIGKTVILIMCVDGMLMGSTPEDHIYALESQLCRKSMELGEEDDASGFLGVKLQKIHSTGQI